MIVYEIIETVRNQPTMFQFSRRKNIGYDPGLCRRKIAEVGALTP